jgi:hypothetical protein
VSNGEVEVQANITVRVRFKDYGSKSSNETALKQISVWLEETLMDEQIPLFINSQYGEQTTMKVVDVQMQPHFTIKE